MGSGGAMGRPNLSTRQSQAEQLHATIIQQLEDLKSGPAWARLLDQMSRFHNYSLNNLLLIRAQCPIATQVAGYRAWQRLGRQVRKGEKAIKIFGFIPPAGRRPRPSENGVDDQNVDAQRTHFSRDLRQRGGRSRPSFPVVNVFDISQTAALESSADCPRGAAQGEPTETRGTSTQHSPLWVNKAPHARLFENVKSYLESLGWATVRADLPESLNGIALPPEKTVKVARDLSPSQATKTLLHETAHVLLHSKLSESEWTRERQRLEVEAESVAYVVSGAFGLDTSNASLPYICAWAQEDMALLKRTAANVQRTARQIIQAVEKTAGSRPAEKPAA